MSLNELRSQVGLYARACQLNAYQWMVSFEPTAADLAAMIPQMVTAHCQSAAILAADWYNQLDADSRYHASPDDQIADERLQATAGWVFRGPQAPENRMRAAAHALVFDAARNTVWSNAQSERVAVARVEEANACGDCAVRATSLVVGRDDVREDLPRDFHHSCEGLLVPVRTGAYEPPQYARKWGEKAIAARIAGNASLEEIAKWVADH